MGVLVHRDFKLVLVTASGTWAVKRHALNKRGS